jgi:hypothetical protein
MSTAAERKRHQRERDARDGMREVSVKVPVESVDDIRAFAALLCYKRKSGPKTGDTETNG